MIPTGWKIERELGRFRRRMQKPDGPFTVETIPVNLLSTSDGPRVYCWHWSWDGDYETGDARTREESAVRDGRAEAMRRDAEYEENRSC